jgi:hypothetical protein
MQKCGIPRCQGRNAYNISLPDGVCTLRKCCECQAAGIPSSIYCNFHDQHEGGMHHEPHLTEYAALHDITLIIKCNSILRQQLFVSSRAWLTWGLDENLDDWFVNEVVALCFLKKWSGRDILGNSFSAVQNRHFLASNIATHPSEEEQISLGSD